MTPEGKPQRSQILEKTFSLQRDIEKHTQIILQLKTELNNWNVAASLPEEPLTRIFYYCSLSSFTLNSSPVVCGALGHSPQPPPPVFPTPLYAWLVVTEVCRQWYSVARHAADLWANIHLPTNLRFAMLSLERSGAVPLMISYDSLSGPPSGWDNPPFHAAPAVSLRAEVFMTVLEHVNRIKNLDLTLSLREYHEISHLLDQPYPSLRNCRISLPYLDVAGIDHTLPLTGDGVLQMLSLTYFSLSPAHISSLSGLRELSLKSMNTWNGPSYTCSSLIDMLAVMPLLETLSLGWTEIIMDSSGEAEAVATMSLPRLRKLQLTALDPTFISGFLDLLRIPGTACLEVTFFATQSPNLTEVDAWPVLRSFASILSPSRRFDIPPPIPTLEFEIAMDSLRLVGYRTQITHRDHLISTWKEQPAGGEVPAQAFVFEIPFALIGGIGLGEITEILPLQDVHILWLRSNVNGIPTPPLSTLSASMPGITAIHAVAIGFECFLSDIDSLISSTLPWPKLTSLVFDTLMQYSYDFHECTCHGNNARGCKCLQRFRDILKFRSANGRAKLTQLSAHDSWFSTYDRSYIRELLAQCADEIVIDELPPIDEMEDTD